MSDHVLLAQPEAPIVTFDGPAEPDELAALFADPFQTVLAFLGGLEGSPGHVGLLPLLVTPQGREEWGDFTAAARLLRRLGSTAVEVLPPRAELAGDVVQARLRGVEADTVSRNPVAVITLVWRPHIGRWLIDRFAEQPTAESLSPPP